MRTMVMMLAMSACGGGETQCPPVAPVEPTPGAEVAGAENAAAEAAGPEAARPSSDPGAMARMDLETMDRLFFTLGTGVVREGGVWELKYQGNRVVVVTDERADRMRIVAPVAAVADLTPDQHAAILAANFHTALDARYAASRGTLYSAFIHRLSTLHPADLESGLRQVATLVQTFGTSYSSGELVFGR